MERRGHLEVLRLARKHDCPWNAWVCVQATVGGQLEALQWAWEHGCLWVKDHCADAARDVTGMCCDWRGSTTACGTWIMMFRRRSGRTPGGVDVGAGALLPAERTY